MNSTQREAIKLANIEAIQKLSMSRDPATAALGRALLALYDPFICYLDRERDRGSEPADVTYGLPVAMGVILGAMLGGMGLPNDTVIQELCLAAVREGLRRAVELEQPMRSTPAEGTSPT